MSSYFCGKYIYTDGDEKEVDRICMRLSCIFGILMMSMSGKAILKLFSIILF